MQVLQYFSDILFILYTGHSSRGILCLLSTQNIGQEPVSQPVIPKTPSKPKPVSSQPWILIILCYMRSRKPHPKGVNFKIPMVCCYSAHFRTYISTQLLVTPLDTEQRKNAGNKNCRRAIFSISKLLEMSASIFQGQTATLSHFLMKFQGSIIRSMAFGGRFTHFWGRLYSLAPSQSCPPWSSSWIASPENCKEFHHRK